VNAAERKAVLALLRACTNGFNALTQIATDHQDVDSNSAEGRYAEDAAKALRQARNRCVVRLGLSEARGTTRR
jgi:hypothetical protein